MLPCEEGIVEYAHGSGAVWIPWAYSELCFRGRVLLATCKVAQRGKSSSSEMSAIDIRRV